MLKIARDISAAFFLEKQLGILREKYLAQALTGDLPDDDFLPSGERAILADLRASFYGKETRKLVSPTEKVSDAEDYDKRGQKLAEHALWMTHRKLTRLPFVGQPQFREQ
jgi:hypothetical protein